MPAFLAALPWVIPPAAAAFGKAVAFVGSAIGAAYIVNEGINAMSSDETNADEQAQTQLQTDAAAATCATGDCPPPGPNCNERNQKIKERRDELNDRYNDLHNDNNNLFYHHYFESQAHPRLGSWEGHLRQYAQKQKNLARQIQDALKAKCSIDTPDAEEWATNSPPQAPKFRFPTPAPPP